MQSGAYRLFTRSVCGADAVSATLTSTRSSTTWTLYSKGMLHCTVICGAHRCRTCVRSMWQCRVEWTSIEQKWRRYVCTRPAYRCGAYGMASGCWSSGSASSHGVDARGSVQQSFIVCHLNVCPLLEQCCLRRPGGVSSAAERVIDHRGGGAHEWTRMVRCLHVWWRIDTTRGYMGVMGV